MFQWPNVSGSRCCCKLTDRKRRKCRRNYKCKNNMQRKLIRWDEKSWGFQIKKSNMFRRFNNSKNRTTILRFTWPLNLGNLLWWKLFLVMELRFFDDGAEQMKMLMIMLMTMMLMLLMTMLLTMILMRYNHIRCSLSFHQFCSSSNFDRALINKTWSMGSSCLGSKKKRWQCWWRWWWWWWWCWWWWLQIMCLFQFIGSSLPGPWHWGKQVNAKTLPRAFTGDKGH